MLYAPMVMLSKVMPCQCIVGKLWNAFASSGPVVSHIDVSLLSCSDDGRGLHRSSFTADVPRAECTLLSIMVLTVDQIGILFSRFSWSH
jgi:hypothetical protein